MRRFFLTALSFTLSLCALAADPVAALPTLTPAMKADIEAMQERVPAPERPGATVASAKAITAANRVFSGLPLVGLTREQVILLLGKPSDFFAATTTKPGRMTYTFDSGPAGRQFLLAVDAQGKVTAVSSQHYD